MAKYRDDMFNDPELNGKYLGTISGDFVKVADTLKEASYQIRVRGFSDYPIFPVCKEEQPIGQLLSAVHLPAQRGIITPPISMNLFNAD